MGNNPNERVKLTFAIMGVNLLLLILYQVILLYGHPDYLFSATCICIHATALGVSSAIASETKYRFMSMGLAVSIPVVLLVGFGTCAIR